MNVKKKWGRVSKIWLHATDCVTASTSWPQCARNIPEVSSTLGRKCTRRVSASLQHTVCQKTNLPPTTHLLQVYCKFLRQTCGIFAMFLSPKDACFQNLFVPLKFDYFEEWKCFKLLIRPYRLNRHWQMGKWWLNNTHVNVLHVVL